MIKHTVMALVAVAAAVGAPVASASPVTHGCGYDSPCTSSDGMSDNGAHASGAAVLSPGVGSGNLVQVPVAVPVNVCGNTVSVIGALNYVHNVVCVNE